MTQITDVPVSGVYYQQGAIVQIIVQLVDIVTGEPVQLQTATGLTISIKYPDLTTWQTFNAQLYTDGSDGRIYYITKNDGTTIDLSQAGLYQVQGQAVIGGVSIPQSLTTDFYVLENVFGGSTMPLTTPSAMILYDSSNVRWAGTVDPSGVISWAALPSGPAGYLQFNSIVMKDGNGVYWTQTIDTDGVVTPAMAGTFPEALAFFFLTDVNGKTWKITANEAGVLEAA